jgi:chemotaxis protein methyltransferase CheR
MNLVTINETSFFRFEAQFDVLRDTVIPEILGARTGGDEAFRMWSAGCSTGEEPYTLAITALGSMLPASGCRTEILGTDVSTDALERARHAIYPARSLAALRSETVRRFFESVPEGFRPVDEVRTLCRFRYHNLVKEQDHGPLSESWDVIFCRNVTIYFHAESTKRVVDRFFDALNPGGYLFIGHSETLNSISDRFEVREIGGVFVYRKPPSGGTLLGDATRRSAELRRTSAATRDGAGDSPENESPTCSAEETVPGAEGMIARAHELLETAAAREALEIASEVLAADPANVEAQLVTAFAHADLGSTDEAAAQAEATLGANPLVAPARYVLGIIKRERGDLEGALAEFRRTLYADQDFVLAHFAIASIECERGNVDEATREYRNTLNALGAATGGSWTAFLGGFRPDLLVRTCELGLAECAKARAKD